MGFWFTVAQNRHLPANFKSSEENLRLIYLTHKMSPTTKLFQRSERLNDYDFFVFELCMCKTTSSRCEAKSGFWKSFYCRKTKALELSGAVSRCSKVLTMTSDLVKNTPCTRGSLILNFLISNKEPIVKAITMSSYAFRSNCRDLRNKNLRQLIAKVLFCIHTLCLGSCLTVFSRKRTRPFGGSF